MRNGPRASGFGLRAAKGVRQNRALEFRNDSGRSPLAVFFVLAACTHPAPPAPPAHDEVRDEIAAAETAEKARKHDEARAHYERAVAAAHDPPHADRAHREFAETLASWGEIPAAIAHLERATTAAPDDAAAWHDLGILRHHEHDDPGAIAALVHARTLAARDPRPRIALAALYWQTGDKANARRVHRPPRARSAGSRARQGEVGAGTTEVRWHTCAT